MEAQGVEDILDVVGQQLPAAGVEFLMIGGRGEPLKPLCDQFADEIIYSRLAEYIREERNA